MDMYRALQIANYIVSVAFRIGRPITNLHLQKILYYLQAKELVFEGIPLFNDTIEKWKLGPVVPQVYHEYKEYGSQPIEKIATEIIFDDKTFDIKPVEFNENDIEDGTKENITPDIISLLNEDPFKLVDLTHEHDPWKKDKERIENGEKGLKYSNEEIYDFFTEFPEKLYEVLGGS